MLFARSFLLTSITTACPEKESSVYYLVSLDFMYNGPEGIVANTIDLQFEEP